ncbi:MAG: STT3 domain-containing protein [Sulfurospirillaceae bacterium]|nr:STT3 domain-containing protein [Sulfurospirillaceae bacterium]
MKTVAKPPLKSSDMPFGVFLFLMLLAYAFSVGIRLIWVFQFSGFEQFVWNGELMINTNDGYYFAEGARDILNGFHQPNDLSPISTPLSLLTAFFVKTLPFSFETVILYMSTCIGSLLVVPMMLFARVFQEEWVGFSGALIGSIAVSYYNRTMTGYFDTDMLVVVLPLMVVCFSLYVLHFENQKVLFIAPLFVCFGLLWHPAVLHVGNGVFAITLVYMLLFERKNPIFYQFLSILIISLMTLDMGLKIALIIALNLLFVYFKERLEVKILLTLLFTCIVAYVVLGGYGWLMIVFKSEYFTRAVINDIASGNTFNYFEVLNTVREAGNIPFETFAHRISGSTIGLIISVAGYLLFVYRYKLALLSLPMVILGFFALRGGLRFTVFAVPLMALGASFFIFMVAKYIQNFITKEAQKVAYGVFVGVGVMAMLYPNLQHIVNYKVPTVFMKNEVQTLDLLGKQAQREDYVVTWWDYGYPIRYYSDMKTLIDGGKHSGSVNFPVSFSLLSDQVAGANMARLAVEYTEKPSGGGLVQMMQDYGEKNVTTFLNSLSNKQFSPPAKTRDVYFYLPDRMLSIFPTVALFSTIDLKTGNQQKKPFFYAGSPMADVGDKVDLGNGVLFFKDATKVVVGGQTLPINTFVLTSYDANKKLTRSVKHVDISGSVFVIFMKDYNRFLVLDYTMFNSLFIQLYALENYDPELFEATILTPYAKVYRLKR